MSSMIEKFSVHDIELPTLDYYPTEDTNMSKMKEISESSEIASSTTAQTTEEGNQKYDNIWNLTSDLITPPKDETLKQGNKLAEATKTSPTNESIKVIQCAVKPQPVDKILRKEKTSTTQIEPRPYKRKRDRHHRASSSDESCCSSYEGSLSEEYEDEDRDQHRRCEKICMCKLTALLRSKGLLSSKCRKKRRKSNSQSAPMQSCTPGPVFSDRNDETVGKVSMRPPLSNVFITNNEISPLSTSYPEQALDLTVKRRKTNDSDVLVSDSSQCKDTTDPKSRVTHKDTHRESFDESVLPPRNECIDTIARSESISSNDDTEVCNVTTTEAVSEPSTPICSATCNVIPSSNVIDAVTREPNSEISISSTVESPATTKPTSTDLADTTVVNENVNSSPFAIHLKYPVNALTLKMQERQRESSLSPEKCSPLSCNAETVSDVYLDETTGIIWPQSLLDNKEKGEAFPRGQHEEAIHPTEQVATLANNSTIDSGPSDTEPRVHNQVMNTPAIIDSNNQPVHENVPMVHREGADKPSDSSVSASRASVIQTTTITEHSDTLLEKNDKCLDIENKDLREIIEEEFSAAEPLTNANPGECIDVTELSKLDQIPVFHEKLSEPYKPKQLWGKRAFKRKRKNSRTISPNKKPNLQAPIKKRLLTYAQKCSASSQTSKSSETKIDELTIEYCRSIDTETTNIDRCSDEIFSANVHVTSNSPTLTDLTQKTVVPQGSMAKRKLKKPMKLPNAGLVPFQLANMPQSSSINNSDTPGHKTKSEWALPVKPVSIKESFDAMQCAAIKLAAVASKTSNMKSTAARRVSATNASPNSKETGNGACTSKELYENEHSDTPVRKETVNCTSSCVSQDKCGKPDTLPQEQKNSCDDKNRSTSNERQSLVGETSESTMLKKLDKQQCDNDQEICLMSGENVQTGLSQQLNIVRLPSDNLRRQCDTVKTRRKRNKGHKPKKNKFERREKSEVLTAKVINAEPTTVDNHLIAQIESSETQEDQVIASDELQHLQTGDYVTREVERLEKVGHQGVDLTTEKTQSLCDAYLKRANGKHKQIPENPRAYPNILSSKEDRRPAHQLDPLLERQTQELRQKIATTDAVIRLSLTLPKIDWLYDVV